MVSSGAARVAALWAPCCRSRRASVVWSVRGELRVDVGDPLRVVVGTELVYRSTGRSPGRKGIEVLIFAGAVFRQERPALEGAVVWAHSVDVAVSAVEREAGRYVD